MELYAHPVRLLPVCAMLLYWIGRVWMMAFRHQMHDDSIAFALKDKTSYAIGAMCFLVLYLATTH